MKHKSRIRLFVDADLGLASIFSLEQKQNHYLFHVMKQESGGFINCFDGKNGEYVCQIKSIDKKGCILEKLEKVKDFYLCPDIQLLFAPVKKDNTDFIIEKATELGVRQIVPVITRRTVSEKVNVERFRAQSIEACEQCRRTDIPEIAEVVSLEKALKNWDEKRVLFYMDESGRGNSVYEVFNGLEYKSKPSAILVGPEGGFDEDEFELLRKQKFAIGVSLGKRILRAETAVVSALSCWQSVLGDWQNAK